MKKLSPLRMECDLKASVMGRNISQYTGVDMLASTFHFAYTENAVYNLPVLKADEMASILQKKIEKKE